MYAKWDGSHTADDYRTTNAVMYCNPASGTLTSHGFPENVTGLFISWHNDATMQLYAVPSGLYYRYALGKTYAFTAWSKL